jgi:hypothetical protein
MIDKSVVLPFPTQTNNPSPGLLADGSSSWAYTLTIGLIFCGLFIPAIQALF